MNPAAGKVNVVNVSNIIGIWVNFQDVCSLQKWRGLMTVQSKNLLKPISKFVSRMSYIVYREEERRGKIKQKLKFKSRGVVLYADRNPA
jgi:hypothetical protein